jgi:two-component system, OmpR family, phosphate regulon response regulator PhoB
VAKILCVEDSGEFLIFLTSVLKDHSVTHATSIQQALGLVRDGRDSFDLVLLDISLPDGNGLEALPQIKDAFLSKSIPVIILSADSDVITKVAAFGIGADDYISKPPNASELRARIEARLRSTNVDQKNKLQARLGDLVLDSDTLRAQMVGAERGPQLLDLTPSEFKLLKLLIIKPGWVYSRDQLIDHVWGMGRHVTPRTVDTHISNLRKKLMASVVKIETVTGTGYRAVIKDKKKDSDSL